MAASNSALAELNVTPAFHPSVSVERWLHEWHLFGTKAGLMHHAECPAGIFDGEGLAWKAQRTITTLDGRWAQVRRTGRAYEVTLLDTAAEIAATEAAEADRRHEDRRKFLAAGDMAAREIVLRTVLADLAQGRFGALLAGAEHTELEGHLKAAHRIIAAACGDFMAADAQQLHRLQTANASRHAVQQVATFRRTESGPDSSTMRVFGVACCRDD